MRVAYWIVLALFIAAMALLLSSCDQKGGSQPAGPVTPDLDGYYHVWTDPGWSAGPSGGPWRRYSAYTITDDSLVIVDSGRRYAYAVRIERSGAELWLTTEDDMIRIRGEIVRDELRGGMVERNRSNPRYNTLSTVTFTREP